MLYADDKTLERDLLMMQLSFTAEQYKKHLIIRTWKKSTYFNISKRGFNNDLNIIKYILKNSYQVCMNKIQCVFSKSVKILLSL